MILRYIAGPLIGTVIGYCTNYIAVKMLFYPKRELYLFGHRVPLTPGAIPKGKPRLAKAAGQVVGNMLLTKEDLEARICSKEVTEQISRMVMTNLEKSTKDMLIDVTKTSPDRYEEGKERLSYVLGNEIVKAAGKMNLSALIVEKGVVAVMDKIKGTMFEMFISEDKVTSMVEPMGAEIETMIAEEGLYYVQPALFEQLSEMEQGSAVEMLNTMGVAQEDVVATCEKVLKESLVPVIGDLLDKINVSGMVEEKINAMSVDTLEEVVLTVMKNELTMIVNLGALIGFVLGLVNLLVF